MNKLTSDELIERARQSKLDRVELKEVYLNSIDGAVLVKKIPLKEISNFLDGIEDDYFDTTIEMIYTCVPIFQNKELIELFEVTQPYEVVAYILNDNMSDIKALSNAILDFYGFNDINETINGVKN